MKFIWIKLLVIITARQMAEGKKTSGIHFPCLDILAELAEDEKRQEMPGNLQLRLKTTARKLESYTRLIRTGKDLCWYVQQKVFALLYDIYKVEIQPSALRDLLFNSDNRTTSNGTDFLRRTAVFHVISCKYLIDRVVSIRKKACERNNGIYDESNLSCVQSEHRFIERSDNHQLVNETNVYILKTATIAGNATSIFFLLLLCIIYMKCKDLQGHLPSKCILCLSLTQVLFHTLLLIAIKGAENKPICTGISILSHWSSLSSFMWLFFVSCETLVTFMDAFRFDKEVRFIAYMSMAFGVSAILIAVCTILNFSTENLMKYGTISNCFIEDTMSNIFAYIVPISIILTINFILSVATFIRFKGSIISKNGSCLARNRTTIACCSSRTLLPILTLILSLMILIARILELQPGSIERESARFVLSLQGLLGFIAFACNKKVFVAVKKKLKKDQAPSRLTYKYRASDKFLRS